MSPPPRTAPIEVLLVEDNRDDAALAIRALEGAKLRNRVTVVGSGLDALAVLRREDRFGDAPRPDLILLDLNLPGKDGRDVLAEIKGDDMLRDIPIVVVTGSQDEADVRRSYGLHANAYVIKPIDPKAFLEAVGSIEQFWLQIVRLP